MGNACSRTRADALDELRKIETATGTAIDETRFHFLHWAIVKRKRSKDARRAEREFLSLSIEASPEWGEGWSFVVEPCESLSTVTSAS